MVNILLVLLALVSITCIGYGAFLYLPFPIFLIVAGIAGLSIAFLLDSKL